MANDRITQVPVEVLIDPDDDAARTSQLVVETALAENPAARTSQLVVEVVFKVLPQSRTQAIIID